MQPRAAIFDVGNVLYEWHLRFLYERLIPDDQALKSFLRDVVTTEWHVQHDAGRPFAETSAELIALYPQHAHLIAALGPRFDETIRAIVPGMDHVIADLYRADVPLFAITNFSGEFFRPFRAKRADMFDRFRDIVVSGDEKLMKPDPAIYRLALDRFGLHPAEAIFFDDNVANVDAAKALGIAARQFTDSAACRDDLVAVGLLPA